MRALLIMGPTASGKSALALALAERVGGEIVNADSMQAYRELRVLTARPSVQDEASARHHLYGHVAAADAYSAGRWLKDALAALSDIRARGRTPIVVGGTGLYFKALTQGLADIPAADAETRACLRARAEAEGAAALHAELAARDPVTAARLERNDAPRILRALEVLEAAGESISVLQANTAPPLSPNEWRGVALTPPREALYAAIDARFAAMLDGGVLQEVHAFAALGVSPDLPVMKAHGLPALMAHLRGELSLIEAAEIAKRDTRRYAKRQFTWIANQMAGWPRVDATDLALRLDAAARLSV